MTTVAFAGKMLATIAVTAIASGCAAPAKPLYGWDGYQPQVYAYLKDNGNAAPEAQIAALEAAEQQVLARGQALPPGYQAHLAMLYAKTGQADKTAERLAAEKTQFPESSGFMDFLSRNFTGKGAQ